MKYKSGYKYQLDEDERVKIPITGKSIRSRFIRLSVTGILTVESGYAWDGPSGPAVDTKNFMRGSLVHDVLYQLMRNGKLKGGKWRDKADRILQQMCIEDGMWRIRAWWVYTSLKHFGGGAASEKNAKEILEAP